MSQHAGGLIVTDEGLEIVAKMANGHYRVVNYRVGAYVEGRGLLRPCFKRYVTRYRLYGARMEAVFRVV